MGGEEVVAPVPPQVPPHRVDVVGVVLRVVVLDQERRSAHRVVVALPALQRSGPGERHVVEPGVDGIPPCRVSDRRRGAAEVQPDQPPEQIPLASVELAVGDALRHDRRVGNWIVPREDVVRRHVGRHGDSALLRIQAGEHRTGQLLLVRQEAQPAVRSVGHDGGLGTEELRRRRDLVADHRDVQNEVVAADPPRPRSVAPRITEHAEPVPVVARIGVAGQPATDELDVHDAAARSSLRRRCTPGRATTAPPRAAQRSDRPA